MVEIDRSARMDTVFKLFTLICTTFVLCAGTATAANPIKTREQPPLGPGRRNQPSSCRYTFQIQRVAIGSKQVEVELYRPQGSGLHPLIVTLHGSEGALTRHFATPQEGDNFGESIFAEHCFTVAVPHYFDLFGMKSTTDRAFLRREFQTISETLGEIVNIEGQLPDTRKSYIGLYARSYGGYLAIDIAAHDPRIRAISEYGGAWPGDLQGGLLKGVSVLMYHGENDSIVPFGDAVELARQLRRHGSQVLFRRCTGQGHYLNRETRKQQLTESLFLFVDKLSAPYATKVKTNN